MGMEGFQHCNIQYYIKIDGKYAVGKLRNKCIFEKGSFLKCVDAISKELLKYVGHY